MKDDEKGKGPKKEGGEEGNLIAFKKEKEEKAPPQRNRSSKKLPTPTKEEEEEELEIVKLTADEGAIVFKKEGMDLIVPTGENLATDSEYFDEVINTITYMLYALERDDWKDEFISVLKKQIQKDEETDHEAETKRRRSHLKVIK
jgi:hypothetical protein